MGQLEIAEALKRGLTEAQQKALIKREASVTPEEYLPTPPPPPLPPPPPAPPLPPPPPPPPACGTLNKPPQKASVEVKLICMDDVQEEEVKWIWYPYIPAGNTVSDLRLT